MKMYSRQGLWILFLMCAFPLHIWTIILAFGDLSWVAERTNMWDAVGVASYGLLYAFMESVIVFLVTILLGFLVSRRWDEKRRIVLLSTMVFIASLWAIIGSLYFIFNVSPPGMIVDFLIQSGHPLRYLYTGLLVMVSITFMVPIYFILKSEKTCQSFWSLTGRLALLAGFYLFLDLVGLIIVIIRNSG